jgi:hypothetical protein
MYCQVGVYTGNILKGAKRPAGRAAHAFRDGDQPQDR